MPDLGFKSRLVVFTDLDGTLLDSRTYATDAAARRMIARLRAREVPVVFCSSKTRAEQSALQSELGLAGQPCIVENGAAILMPETAEGGAGAPRTPGARGHPDNPRRSAGSTGEGGKGLRMRAHPLGLPAVEIRARIQQVETRLGRRFTGYSAIGAEGVSRLTGLDMEASRRAVLREYSETLVDEFPREEWKSLDECFAAEGLQCLHGGRFHTVTARGTDKGRAVAELTAQLRAASELPVVTVALGDSANDRSMLAAVDLPVLLQRERGGWIDLDLPNLLRVDAPGPAGWSIGLERCIEAVTTSRR